MYATPTTRPSAIARNVRSSVAARPLDREAPPLLEGLARGSTRGPGMSARRLAVDLVHLALEIGPLACRRRSRRRRAGRPAGGRGERRQVELDLLLALDLAEAAVLDEADRVRVVGADLQLQTLLAELTRPRGDAAQQLLADAARAVNSGRTLTSDQRNGSSRMPGKITVMAQATGRAARRGRRGTGRSSQPGRGGDCRGAAARSDRAAGGARRRRAGPRRIRRR